MQEDATLGNSVDGNNPSSDEQLAYTVPRAAKVLDLGVRTVWGLIYSGQIESVKFGAARRIPRAALLAYVENRRGAA